MKIEFRSVGCASPTDLSRNVAYAHSLGLPMTTMAETPRSPVAVIGGAPSVIDAVDELRAFPGERWIIGSAFPWAVEIGLEGTFFCIDAEDIVAPLCRGAKKALLATCVHPSVLDGLLSDGCDIELFDIGVDSVPTGSTTATGAPYLSLLRGHPKAFFYGCDSSFAERTHAYKMLEENFLLLVKSGDGEYLTNPQMMIQADELSTVLREYPDIYVNKSGGLLQAMIENDCQWDVLKVSRALNERLSA